MIQVAVIEDERDIREGLRSLIGGTPGFAVSGVYRCMEEALNSMPAALPQVALIDIELRGMSGIQGMRLLKESYPYSADGCTYDPRRSPQDF
jgi:DNA-binding NarL/FixJ family response regulator